MYEEKGTITTSLTNVTDYIQNLYLASTSPSPTSSPSSRVLPTTAALDQCRSTLLNEIPQHGLGVSQTSQHLIADIAPGVNQGSLSPHYYGFVIGGVTPAAFQADLLATAFDQNVHVHVPNETIATDVEDRALRMLLQLLRLEPEEWMGRTFTTGATGANILGLACGREVLLKKKLMLNEYADQDASVGEMGVLEACVQAGVMGIQVLEALAHSSIPKAASVVGIGRSKVYSVGRPSEPWEFDLSALETRLKEGSNRGVLSIVVAGFGEVNTGRFSSDIHEVRELCDTYGAYLHIDAAFGAFARVFGEEEEGELKEVARWAKGLELADSICGDAHKALNVPYDSGFFFTRSSEVLQRIFVNSAPYLSTAPSSTPSPLNIGLENSRRWRALPAYSSLAAYGVQGYQEMMKRMILHARAVAKVILRHPAYELLPLESGSEEDAVGKIFIVVLFRAKDEDLNKSLKERINATGKMYVSGTVWDGKPAVRVAVCNWRVSEKREGHGGWGRVEEVLEEVAPPV